MAADDFAPRDYQRRIHPEWNDPADPVGNILAEISDMNERPELLSPSDEKFLVYITVRRIRSHRDGAKVVYLTDRQVHRLDCLIKRYTQAHVGARFIWDKEEAATAGTPTRPRTPRASPEPRLRCASSQP